jgi:TetR/AcrR family transcriptional regulator, transcriptional repressor of bet genes
MPKVGMEDLRRRQLIAATIISIHEEGFANATISRISKNAGLSGGIVAHYFDDKAGLLAATMRSLAQDLLRETVRRLKAAETPEERIDAVIMANFSDEQNEPENVSAWLAFWSEARNAPGLWRIQKINERRLLSNLTHAFRQLLPTEDARMAAAGLAAMIEGLWLRCALSNGPLTIDQARLIARDYAKRLLHPHAPDRD